MSNNVDYIRTCSVCHNEYDTQTHPPKFLNCHHRFCLECCANLVNGGEIKCPQCRKITLIFTGRLGVDMELTTDHDFLTLLANVNQPAVVEAPQPSTSREGEARDMRGACKPEELTTEVSSDGSSSSSTEPLKSGKGKGLLKIKKKKHKKRASKRTKRSLKYANTSSSSTEESSSDDADSSDDFKKTSKKGKRLVNRNFTTVKSEMDSLMRKSKLAAVKGRKGKREEKKEISFIKDLFLVADADSKELPPTVDHENLERAGLGLRCDVEFKNSGSSKHVLRVFKRTFPRLDEVSRFYICTKSQGVSRNLTVQHYSTPSAAVLKRLSGKLIVLVPIKNSLAYESSEEGVDCDVCSEKIPIRQWALHIERCTELSSRSKKRRTY